MESIAAIGLASNVAQFLDYAIRVGLLTVELMNSPGGTLKQHREIEANIDVMREAMHSIKSSNQEDARSSKLDRTIQTLATRCISISDEVDGMLNKLRMPEPDRSPTQATKKAMMTIRHKKDLDNLLNRLHLTQVQASTHLIVLLREQQESLGRTFPIFAESSEDFRNDTTKKLEEAVKILSLIAQSADTEGEEVKEHTGKRWHRSKASSSKATVQTPAFNPEAFKKSRASFDDSMETLNGYIGRLQDLAETKEQRILQTLHFSQLKEREFAIFRPYRNTFEWIFNPTSNITFAKWLQDGDGIYWIGGKAGSGKSTLMKFLQSHEKTAKLLGQWAGTHRLIIVDYYFWNPGTTIQKSFEGLLRSLLLQILRKLPQLIPLVCSTRWGALYADSFNPWSREELLRTLEALGTTEEPHLKICLFIDGLDESSEDHQNLLSALFKVGGYKNVKICTSSRPWLDFSDAFENSPWKLHLHNLTAQDIIRYIEDNLGEHTLFRRLQTRDKSAALDLISEIASRAHGVFLWVFLVIRSLLRGLRNEDGIPDLQRRLRELPSDLQEYFDRMLRTIEDVYRKRVARLFLTMSHAEISFPLITFYFLNFEDEPISTEPLPLLQQWPDVDLAEVEVLAIKKRQLIAQCRDLIFVTMDPQAHPLFAETVSFLHRTVVDYLCTANIQRELLQLAAPDFDPKKTLFEANLGQVRSMIHLHRLTYIQSYLRQWVLGCLYYAQQSEISGRSELAGLDELETIITQNFQKWGGFAHGIECILGMTEIGTFLELASKCDLATYVTEKLPECSASDLDRLAPEWRNPCFVLQESSFELRPMPTEGNMSWRLGAYLKFNLEHHRQNSDVRWDELPSIQQTSRTTTKTSKKRRGFFSRIFKRASSSAR